VWQHSAPVSRKIYQSCVRAPRVRTTIQSLTSSDNQAACLAKDGQKKTEHFIEITDSKL
jgi:hypothetical protein